MRIEVFLLNVTLPESLARSILDRNEGIAEPIGVFGSQVESNDLKYFVFHIALRELDDMA